MVPGLFCVGYLQGQIHEIILEFFALNVDFAQTDELERFLKLITHLNSGEAVNSEYEQ